MKFMNILVIMILLVSLASAYPAMQSTAYTCFNLNASAEALTGSASSAWYDVAIVALPHNGSFSNATMTGYYVPTSAAINVFKIGENSTHYFMAIPIIESITTAQKKRYCIYAATTGMNDLNTIAPYNLGFDGDETMASIDGICTPTSSAGIVNITYTPTADACVLKLSTTFTANNNLKMLTKMKVESATDVNSRLGGWTGASSTRTTSGWGIGSNSTRLIGGWYTDATPANIAATDSSWHIYKTEKANDMAAHTIWVYDENYTTSSSGTATPTIAFGVYPRYSSPAYVRGGSGLFDFGFIADGNLVEPNATDVTYDTSSSLITIQNPTWGSIYTDKSTVLISVLYGNDFENCNISLGTTQIDAYPAGNGTIHTTIVDSADSSFGDNYVNVTCNDSTGAYSHAYSKFTKTSGNTANLFTLAFGSDVSSSCSGTVLTELSKCFEYHRLNNYYNFSAVVCQGINTSLSYSCIAGTTKYTKYPYTIFYAPASWVYANSSVNIPHTGAWFYYANAPITTEEAGVSIELINNTHFIYGLAQSYGNKSRDCGIYYTSTAYCSWARGFIVNGQPVVFDDTNNNWYIAGGNGIIGYDANYSQITIPVQASKLNDLTIIRDILNNQSIVQRAVCQEKNGTLYVDVVNTLPVVYTVYVYGNSSYSFTNTNYELDVDIPVTDVDNVTVYMNNNVACAWNDGNNLFLPFNLTWIGTDGFGGMILNMIMLFLVLLSAVVPYAFVTVFVFNDLYHVLNITQIGLLGVFCGIAAILNNIYNVERGIKHMIIILAIATAFISSMTAYQAELGVDLDSYTGFVHGFSLIAQPESLGDVAAGVFTILISVFSLVLFLPFLVASLLMELLGVISPEIAGQASGFMIILTIGMYIALWLKGYEVIRNTFRNV